MNFKKRNRAAKLEFRCFQCRGTCAAKDGDWHSSPGEGSQQVFLCRSCEPRAQPFRSMNTMSNVPSLSAVY
jgi:hypothetical protein